MLSDGADAAADPDAWAVDGAASSATSVAGATDVVVAFALFLVVRLIKRDRKIERDRYKEREREKVEIERQREREAPSVAAASVAPPELPVT